MNDLPSHVLALHDGSGARFGFLRLAPRDDDGKRWDCIFDIEPTEDQAVRSEVRWLWKRRYRRYGEHRIKQGDDGTLTVTLNEFRLVLHPDEDQQGFVTRSPAPPISARWDRATTP